MAARWVLSPSMGMVGLVAGGAAKTTECGECLPCCPERPEIPRLLFDAHDLLRTGTGRWLRAM